MALDELFNKLKELQGLPSDAERHLLRLEGRWIVTDSQFDAYMTHIDLHVLREWTQRFADYLTPMHLSNFSLVYRRVVDRELLGLFVKEEDFL